MRDIFYEAKRKLIGDLPLAKVAKRLTTIHLRTVGSEQMAKSLNGDNYRRYANIPAYYDPNTHTVFLNETCLSQAPVLTQFIICYHELIHGASLHANYKLPSVNVFQSGVKFERYQNNRYICHNRLLNEGIVQFMTTRNNQIDDSSFAYAHEVTLVKKIAIDLGIPVLIRAILYEEYTQFTLRFDERYGPLAFSRFTRYLDKRQYDKAQGILSQSEPTQTISYSYATPSQVGVG